MPSIGEIRVDFLADVTKFVSGLSKGSNGLSRFAADVSRTIGAIEKSTQKLGMGMTTKVTAPIGAMAFAAVKAADTNGEAMKRMQEDAKRMQQSLAPLGRELIKAYDAARPTIQQLAGIVRKAADEFSRLPEPTKRVVLQAVAVTAAVGPAALAISSMAKVAGVAFSPFVKLTGGIAGLANGTTTLVAAMNTGKVSAWFGEFSKGNPALMGTVKGMMMLAVAAAALETGSWLGKQPVILNANLVAMNALTAAWDNFFNILKQAWTSYKGFVQKTLGEILTSVATTVDTGVSMLPAAVRSRMGVVAGGASALKGSGATLIQQGQESINRATIDRYRMLHSYMMDQGGPMSQLLGGRWTGPSWMESAREDLGKINELVSKLFQVGPAAAGANADAWKKWDGAVKRVKVQMEDLAKYAEGINEKYTPEVSKLSHELAKLDMLRVEGLVGAGKPLSMENWKRAVDAIRKQIADIETAAKNAWRAPVQAGIERYQEAVEKARSMYLQAYPEAAYRSDIANLEKMRDDFLSVGDAVSAGLVGGVISRRVKDHDDEIQRRIDENSAKLQQWDETLGGQLYASVSRFSSNVGDAFDQMRQDGELAFDKLGDAFISMLIRTSMAQMTSPLFEWFGRGVASFVGNPMPASGSGGAVVGPWGTRGYVQPHAAGGITSSPIFTHVAGERGREVIAPLSQLPGLLARSGMGGAQVQIIDQRGAGSPVQVRETRGPDGRRIITALIKDAAASGELDTIMSQRFNLRANPRG